jgi:hypothetical protein
VQLDSDQTALESFGRGIDGRVDASMLNVPAVGKNFLEAAAPASCTTTRQ